MRNAQKFDPLLAYRTVDESEAIERARKNDAQFYYQKYKTELFRRVCPICDSSEYKILQPYADSFNIVQCKKCTLIYVQDAPSRDCLDDYYQNSESVKLLTEFYLKRNSISNNIVSNSRLEIVKDTALSLNKTKLSILEVGCGDGRFLKSVGEALHNKGFSVTLSGVEPNAYSAQIACENGVNVESMYIGSGSEDGKTLCENNYDLVFCFELIEHVPFPKQLLQSLYSAMCPGGKLILTTPHINGLENILTGYNGYRLLAHAICPPAHLQGFDKLSMGILAVRVGFCIESIEAKGAFDAYALQYYSDHKVLEEPSVNLYKLTNIIKRFGIQNAYESIQQLVNILDASSTMTCIFRKAQV